MIRTVALLIGCLCLLGCVHQQDSRPQPAEVNENTPAANAGASAPRVDENPEPAGRGAQFEKKGTPIKKGYSRNLKLFYLENQFRWEARALNDALRRDAMLEYRGLFLSAQRGWRQPVSYNRTLKSLDTSFVGPGGALRDAQKLAAEGLDVVIVGDVALDKDVIAAECWESLEAWVKGGGGLILLAGSVNMPVNCRASVAFNRLCPMAEVEPGKQADIDTTKDKYWGLTAEGQDHEVFRLSVDPQQVRELFGSEREGAFVRGGLNGVFWYAGGLKPKAEATVLARAVPDGEAVATGEPMVASMALGKGRVLWVGTDDANRIREFFGDTYFYRLWQNMIRWAANDPGPG